MGPSWPLLDHDGPATEEDIERETRVLVFWTSITALLVGILFGPLHPTTNFLLVEVLHMCHCALAGERAGGQLERLASEAG
jgi:hypothetical protein